VPTCGGCACSATACARVPNAVESAPPAGERDPSLPPTLLFVGPLSYPPNLEACASWPATSCRGVRRACPGARLELIGAQPQLLRSRAAAEGVDVLGFVPTLARTMRARHSCASPNLRGLGRVSRCRAARTAAAVVARGSERCGLNLVEGSGDPPSRTTPEGFRIGLHPLIQDAPAARRHGGRARGAAAGRTTERSAIMRQIERLIAARAGRPRG